MDDWREFFEKHRDYSVQASFYECRRDFKMEELYQAFKARMQQEAREDAHPEENCPARTSGNSCIC